ncbi:MAG: rhodanese-like domain-containing protein [Desulfobulbaceae bacterium]|nr:rhodanese-like domain-containing protein [Desulfobulbaceae bacterium]
MKRTSHLAFLIPFLLLLCGFFWSDLTWEQMNAAIEHQYPSVKHIDIESLKASLDQGIFLILIDVRKEDEFAVSHLQAAVNIQETTAVNHPKDTPIVVYCSVGVRSAGFAKKLDELGFTNVLNLRGSIFGWGNKGYPLIRGATAVNTVHPYNKKWGKLLNQELHQYRVPSE